LVPADPEADRRALQRLCWFAQQYSPFAGLEETEFPECLLLETSGCEAHWGEEPALLRAIRAACHRQGLVVRVAVSGNIGASWAMAHFGPNPGMVVAAGQETAELEGLPLAALRLPASTVAALQEVGIGRIGQLAALPRETVHRRFGAEVLCRLDQACGRREETFLCEHPPEPVVECRNFEVPLRQDTAVVEVLRRLLGQGVVRLQERTLGAQRLEVRLRAAGFSGSADVGLQPPAVTTITIRLLRPASSLSVLQRLLELKLEGVRLPGEVGGVELELTDLRPWEVRQPTLFGERHRDGTELGSLIEQLSSRLGEQAVLCGRLIEEDLPERDCEFLPAAGRGWPGEPEALPAAWPGPRPLLLRVPPQPVGVTSVLPDGPPVRLHLGRQDLRIVLAEGPERVETGWWRLQDEQRDYYRVETEDGRWLWLFRQRQTGEWSLQGTFA
jgi:protein ImuB